MKLSFIGSSHIAYLILDKHFADQEYQSSTILPGVTIGKWAIVDAASVVTAFDDGQNADIPDYAVAVGNPSRVKKYLDKDKFENQ